MAIVSRLFGQNRVIWRIPKHVCVVGWPKGEDGVRYTVYAFEARVEFSRDWRSGGSAGSYFGRLVLRRANSGGPTANTVGRVRRPIGISVASRSIVDVVSSTRALFRRRRAVPVAGSRGGEPFIARHRSRSITIVRGAVVRVLRARVVEQQRGRRTTGRDRVDDLAARRIRPLFLIRRA